jgi:ribosomal-protein-alanine N-acetyltransferase
MKTTKIVGSIDEAISLHKEIFAEDNPKFFDSLKKDSYYHVFVAEQNNVPIAYCIISVIAGEAELINIGTRAQYRQKGEAKELLLYAIQNIEADTIFLEVSHKNLAAIALYKSCGFIACGLRKNYYGDSDAILMKLQKNAG